MEHTKKELCLLISLIMIFGGMFAFEYIDNTNIFGLIQIIFVGTGLLSLFTLLN